jgi:hypothetical protein
MGFAAWVSLPTPLLGDNNAAITLARNDILTQGNRFYTPDLHYAKEVYENGWCCPRKVASEDNVSDGGTKCVTTSIFIRHQPMVLGYGKLPPIPPTPKV